MSRVARVIQEVQTQDDPHDIESTVPGERSEEHSQSLSDFEFEDDEQIRVEIKHTFIEMTQGGIMHRYRKLRKSKTEFLDRAICEPEDEFGTSTSEEPGSATPDQDDDTTDEDACDGEERRTVMLRNVPNNYTREMFLNLLDELGFGGKYDFVYLPCDSQRFANLGYAFVNLVDERSVKDMWRKLDGFAAWTLPTTKVCQVTWSGPHQGLEAHVERYRNSPVMHKRVPDEFKPVLFSNGVRQKFPEPTKRLKLPCK